MNFLPCIWFLWDILSSLFNLRSSLNLLSLLLQLSCSWRLEGRWINNVMHTFSNVIRWLGGDNVISGRKPSVGGRLHLSHDNIRGYWRRNEWFSAIRWCSGRAQRCLRGERLVCLNRMTMLSRRIGLDNNNRWFWRFHFTNIPDDRCSPVRVY